MSATIDTRAIKTATDPESDYMGYFGKLIDKNKDAYIQCDADGACTYAGNNAQEALQNGIAENLADYGVIFNVTQNKKLIQNIQVLGKKNVSFSLMPGTYEWSVSDERTKRILGSNVVNVNFGRSDNVSKISGAKVDFRIGWKP